MTVKNLEFKIITIKTNKLKEWFKIKQITSLKTEQNIFNVSFPF